MESNSNIDNLKALEDFFNSLSLTDQRKIFLKAYKNASQPILAQAAAGIPIRSGGAGGTLRKSLGTIAVRNEIAIEVGSLKRKKGWYGHMIEGGTVERFRKTKNGESVSTGRIIGNNFWTNAVNGNIDTIEEAVTNEWLIEIDKALTKTNKELKK